MFASRVLRSTKMVVGISIKDIVGAKEAMRKAISMAQPADKIVALHIPSIVPEMMLSSMSDPSDASDDAFAALSNLPTKAGLAMQEEIKDAANDQMKSLGKQVSIQYKVEAPTGDVKSSLLAVSKAEGANLLFIGPGLHGNGSIPAYLAQQAKGLTVCVVRDHLE
mmetsp:Transcript_104210/g.293878  ORF Transcript_104210/g.293878 Transcript_104210/m.293878 type:complete len:165 (+) Transcript_104210:102-596(+)